MNSNVLPENKSHILIRNIKKRLWWGIEIAVIQLVVYDSDEKFSAFSKNAKKSYLSYRSLR